MSIKKTTIGTSCIVGDGAHASINRVEIGVPYLTSKNFNQDGIYLQKVDYISEQDYQKHFREDSKALTKPSEGDLIFSIIGSIGGAHLYNKTDRFGLSSSVAIIRPNIREVYPQFLLYYLKSPYLQKWLEATKSGSAQGFLSLEMIKNLPLSLPSLPIQQKIASILSAYDELIENNKQRIKLLEEMAEEIYKEWFVRLRFPNYENTEFVDGLPLGWIEGTIGSLYNIKSGFAFKSEDFGDVGFPIIKIRNIDNLEVDTINCDRYCGEMNDRIKKFEIDNGDLLVAMTGATIGKVALFHRQNEAYYVNQRVGKFFKKSNIILNQAFIYQFSKTDDFKSSINNFALGAAQPNISGEQIENIKLFIPSPDLLQNFSKIVGTMIDEVFILKQKNQLLQQTRDLLLPRLISGKLSVAGLLGDNVYKIRENEGSLSMVAEDGV